MANLRTNNLCGDGGRNAIDGSVFFDGSISYLKINDSDAWDFGADNFTIEYWYYEVTTSNTERRTAYLYGPDSPIFQALVVGHTNDNSGQVFFTAHDSSQSLVGAGNVLSASGSNPNGNREGWKHLAVVRNGANLNIYLDGVLSGTNGSFGSTAIRTDQSDWYIGHDPVTAGRNFQGYISNYRVVKGTALYTANFTPPTEKLTAIDGTVLLCCQDSDNTLQEATGKTITAVGGVDFSHNPDNLVKNGRFTLSATAEWTLTGGTATLGTGQSGTFGDGNHVVLTASSSSAYLKQAITTKIGRTYTTDAQSNGGDASFISTSTSEGDAVVTDIRGGKRFTATQTTYYVILRGNTGGANFDTVSVYEQKNSIPPKFLPPYGVDAGNTFDGAISMNSPSYMYFPTGRTEERGRGRGLNGGSSTPSNITTIDYFQIQTTGSTIVFGDLTTSGQHTSCSSSTRGVFAMGGQSSPGTKQNVIDFVTIATTGNAIDFGDRTITKNGPGGLSNQTRGIFMGGGNPQPQSDVIDYITIASLGNAIDFGNMTSGNKNPAGLASPTRGCFAHGGDPFTNTIDYITIATTGNAQDFGDTTESGEGYLACASDTRGIFVGGNTSPANINTIQYITIATTGNATDFGDIGSNRVTAQSGAGTSNNLRGVTMGGANFPNQFSTTMEYVNIDTTGNSFDFGYLSSSRVYTAACSDSHGGLS